MGGSEGSSWGGLFTALEGIIPDEMQAQAHAQIMLCATRDLLPLAVFLRWNRVSPNTLPSNVTSVIVGFFLFPNAVVRHKQQRRLCHLMLERPRIYGQQLLHTQTIDTDTSVTLSNI